MPESDKIYQNIKGEGKLVLDTSLSYPPLEEAFPDIDLTPMEGSFEDKFSALNTIIDDQIGEGEQGHTLPSSIFIWARIYGVDVVQAIIDSGRVGF